MSIPSVLRSAHAPLISEPCGEQNGSDMHNGVPGSRSDLIEEIGLLAKLLLHMLGGVWAVTSGTAAATATKTAASTASPSTVPKAASARPAASFLGPMGHALASVKGD